MRDRGTLTAMTTLSHPKLGPVEVEHGLGYVVADLGGRALEISIELVPDVDAHTLEDDARLDPATVTAWVEPVVDIVPTLAAWDAAAQRALLDSVGEPAVVEYVQHHLQELDAAVLTRRFEVADVAALGVRTFVAGLELVGASLRPGEPDAIAALDYSLGRDLTDYVLVVLLDRNRSCTGFAVEA